MNLYLPQELVYSCMYVSSGSVLFWFTLYQHETGKQLHPQSWQVF
jgi:hypothetical protein